MVGSGKDVVFFSMEQRGHGAERMGQRAWSGGHKLIVLWLENRFFLLFLLFEKYFICI